MAQPRKDVYKSLINYIVSVIEAEYPELTHIETKADKKILYKAVEWLKRTRIVPIFEQFDNKFTRTINEFI